MKVLLPLVIKVGNSEIVGTSEVCKIEKVLVDTIVAPLEKDAKFNV